LARGTTNSLPNLRTFSRICPMGELRSVMAARN
jgi:hypothetical protein